jgi:hypothetical protein
LIVMPKPLPRCAPQVFDRSAQADARGAEQVLYRRAKVFARGAARCASQVLDRGSQTGARSAARCASKVLDRGVQAVALGIAMLPQEDTNNSAAARRIRVANAGFTCKEARKPSRRCALCEFELFAVISRRR